MPRHTEPSANNDLADLLRPILPGWEVRSENTQVISGHPGLQPDILITAQGRSPVVIEAEYMPAHTVEAEARSRLGLSVTIHPRSIEAVVALRYPEEVRDAANLLTALANARVSYAVFTEDGKRFPESGWLDGSPIDLADLIRLMSVPQRAVNAAATALEKGIDRAANILNDMSKLRPGITADIARLLGMRDVPQTRRMAGAIIANALVFHERIAGMHDGVKPTEMVCGPDAANPKGETLAAWTEILVVNYWPIFAIGKDILRQLPSGDAANILRTLQYTVDEVNAAGVNSAHDLTGRIFQRLIADRKYLATFYTLPASAALLARLAVAKINSVDWSAAEAIGKLRIADFACGTGALLAAVYEQIAALHEGAGGDQAKLHPMMMEEALFGCDVMPSAIHITGSTLSGAQPAVQFFRSRLYTLPYGRQQDRSVAIGSLELLQSSATGVLFNTSDPALRTSSIGEETASYVIADVPDEGFDVVIMNPPFTSNTKHYDAGEGVVNAAFAAFDSSEEDQSRMANRLRQLAKDTCYHGHAGEGSVFAALADKKLRPNGVIALVLPFTAINGASWSRFRELIATKYNDITIVSIAANGHDMSFSSDTGMAECLIIGRKIARDEEPSYRAKFVSLRHRPSSFVDAQLLARTIVSDMATRQLEDGPYGGIPIYSGDALAGELLDAPIDRHENGWGAARIRDASVAQTAYSLSSGKLWLPAEPSSYDIPVAQMSQVGRRGLDSQLFISSAHKGPFTKVPPSPTATYPALWNHDAKNETRMVCTPDSQLLVRPGMEAKASEVWATASRVHINRDFTFGSQALVIAFTEWRSIGGRVWPNLIFGDDRFDYASMVWGNSTLGLLSYWWHSSRQQSSKAGMTIRSAESLPVLDFRTLSDEQLATAREVFEEFRDRELMPAYLADADPNRALLDRRVVCDLLGFDESVYEAVRRLAAKWCAEPSVHGGKARPKDAVFVV